MAFAHTLLVFLLWFCSEFGSAKPHITTSKFLKDPETLVSNNGFFKLGFFSPINSTRRYVGIWYNKDSDKLEVIWIANRENPLNDTSGVLQISEDGNLQVVNGQNMTFWSTNVALANWVNNPVAQLQDSGNLVLLSNASGMIIWQSFDYPADSLLPGMKFSFDENTREKDMIFRSWKSPSNPSSGRFTVGVISRTPPSIFAWDGDRPIWRSLPWNGNLFMEISLISDNEGTISLTYTFSNQSLLQHFLVNYDGMVLQKEWNDDSKKWEIIFQSIESECDVYGKCGLFGSCNPEKSPICSCLKGFEPKNNEEWSKGNWTNGCVRRMPLQCGTIGGRTDGFWRLKFVKLPDNAGLLSAQDQDDCRRQCLANCSCLAYSYYPSIGCMIWNGSLIDIKLSSNISLDLFVRLPHSELGGSSKWKIIVVVIVIIGTTIFAVFIYYVWRWMVQRNGARVTSKEKPLDNYMFQDSKREVASQDLPCFGLETLAIATNNFQENNRLGRGGFGPVYKGKLEDGQEIAVKRLSKTSGQGLQEFKNEVLVISKLQHRNLVRLLGYCVQEEEKLLVYEYMPNKSLDAILFDPLHRELLDWKKRFNIIQGICRGILYLHRDSRLRIIHRDLKASNILLDGNLNPKISDFGMARIFGGNQDQADTIRVVGTYGYMSPEYAMEGRFSEKSDVFSFGVLLLEIVSGRRNDSFKDDESLSLLGYAWKLWNEDDILSLVDPKIWDPRIEEEILRCIKLGLLCVQEVAEDRPNISSVISMLDNEVAHLPHPMQPGFTQRRNNHNVPSNGQRYYSVNNFSLTVVSGR